MVGGAVVQPGLLRQHVRQVGGGDEPAARGLGRPGGIQREARHDLGHQPGGRHHLLQGPGNHRVEHMEVIGAGRARVQGHQHPGEVTGHRSGGGAHHGEGVRVALLRHQRARAAVAIGQLRDAELAAGQDLQVLRQLRLMRGRGRRRGHQVHIGIPLPHGVLHVRHRAGGAQQVGQARAVQRPARPRAAAGSGHRHVQLLVDAAESCGIAQHRVGIGQHQVPEARGLRGLQVGVVGGQVGGMPRRQVHQGGGKGHAGVVQVAGAVARHHPQPHPEGLAARAPRRQPSGGHGARTRPQFVLAAVECIAQRGVPREGVTRNGIQLEERGDERPRLVPGDRPGLRQHHRVGQVRCAQPPGQPRPRLRLVAVAGVDQRVGRAAVQAPAAPEVVLRHARQPSGPDGNRADAGSS